MTSELQQLMDLVHQTFHCDENVYRKLKYLPKEMWDNEILTHSTLHLTKSAGKLASISEAYEHGAPFDIEKAKDTTLSALATILKTASMLGMTAEDLLKGVPEKIQYKPKKA